MKMSTNTKMNVENIFHMTGGSGSTSYANNCSFQMKASDMVKHIIVETIEQLYLETFPKTIAMADMGCCSGRNSLPVIKTVVDSVEEKSRLVAAEVEPPEFYVYLNDLPSNDFNSIFKALPGFFRQLMEERNGGVCPSVFIAGCAGSFYGRLLPKNSMQFIYSSYCLHWLSKVPPGLFNEKGESVNKGNLYISESSPPSVSLAYLSQFQDDFSLFLRSRSNELVCRARMLLILLGRLDHDNHVDRGNSFYWELLSRSLAILASQGKIKKEKLDGYHAHFYAASKWEIEEIVRREGSFFLDRFEMYQPDQKTCNGVSYGSAVAMTVRAAQEVMLRHHFGLEDDDGVIDSLFDIYGNMVDEEMSKEEIKAFTFLLVLKKL